MTILQQIGQMFNFADMSVWKIIGQILGFVGMATEFCIYQQNKKEHMVLTKLVADVIWATHFFLIGGWTGAATTTVAIFREVVCYYSHSKKWAQSKVWMYLFCVFFFCCGLFTWKGIYSLFPPICSVISTMAFWAPSPKRTKILQIPSASFMLIYNLIANSISGAVSSILSLTSIAISFTRAAIKKCREKKKRA